MTSKSISAEVRSLLFLTPKSKTTIEANVVESTAEEACRSHFQIRSEIRG